MSGFSGPAKFYQAIYIEDSRRAEYGSNWPKRKEAHTLITGRDDFVVVAAFTIVSLDFPDRWADILCIGSASSMAMPSLISISLQHVVHLL